MDCEELVSGEDQRTPYLVSTIVASFLFSLMILGKFRVGGVLCGVGYRDDEGRSEVWVYRRRMVETLAPDLEGMGNLFLMTCNMRK